MAVRGITDSHELSVLQQAALFQNKPFITTQMCVTVQHNLCDMLSKMDLTGYIYPVMQCGAMQQLINVIRETDNANVRLVAFKVAHNIALDDNGERLIVFNAGGGLQVFANQILSLPFRGVNHRIDYGRLAFFACTILRSSQCTQQPCLILASLVFSRNTRHRQT